MVIINTIELPGQVMSMEVCVLFSLLASECIDERHQLTLYTGWCW